MDLTMELGLNLPELESRILEKFKNKQLYKGVAEVIKAIDQRREISEVYLVGELDPWYEASITKALLETEKKVTLHRIPGKYKRLIYDVIKDVNLKKEERLKSRRFFLTRAFAL